MDKRRTFLDKTFKDKNGHWALIAAPNLPIAIWAIAASASHLVDQGNFHKIFSAVALIAIITWALLEIFFKVNYFRRTLGLIVLAFTLQARL